MVSFNEAALSHLDAIAEQHAKDTEPGHDILHVRRVARSARTIAAAEGADVGIVTAAALLHEIFSYAKDHPESSRSGDVCAERAADILRAEGIASPEANDAICYAIRVHSFSRGIVPTTLEARILQDADRLDALGAVGIARVFSTGSAMRRPFYSADDPFCERRAPDDKEFTLDHFYRKLLLLPDTLHTDTARRLARERTRFLQAFLAQMAREIDSPAA